jgi:hypothetical protein
VHLQTVVIALRAADCEVETAQKARFKPEESLLLRGYPSCSCSRMLSLKRSISLSIILSVAFNSSIVSPVITGRAVYLVSFPFS